MWLDVQLILGLTSALTISQKPYDYRVILNQRYQASAREEKNNTNKQKIKLRDCTATTKQPGRKDLLILKCNYSLIKSSFTFQDFPKTVLCALSISIIQQERK